MPSTVSPLLLPAAAPGTRRSLSVCRWGMPGARPKVYLQAALHADELPALLVARHLRARLDALDAAGQVCGEVVMVPVANPIGLAQQVLARQPGRFDLETGTNFNRGFPDLGAPLIAHARGRLGDDVAANAALVRASLAELAAEAPAEREAEQLKRALLGLAIDADHVLDLHCDGAALLHLYTAAAHATNGRLLARALGAAVLLLEDAAGGAPFDAACSLPWLQLAAATGAPLGPGCFAATVELRGKEDVSDALAGADAEGLLRYMVAIGALSLTALVSAAPATEPLVAALDAVDTLRAPVPGLVLYRRWIGDEVAAGEVVAEIVDLDADTEHRTPVLATTSGLLFAVEAVTRLVRPGQRLCMIAGRERLAYRKPGTLLAD